MNTTESFYRKEINYLRCSEVICLFGRKYNNGDVSSLLDLLGDDNELSCLKWKVVEILGLLR